MRRQFIATLLLCGLPTAGQAQVTELNSVPVPGPFPTAAGGYSGVWDGYGPDCGAAGPFAFGTDCGGGYDGCGVGGYFGRNIHPVAPCVCGGSLCLDILRGVRHLLDRTVSCVFGTVFGGLHAVSCHAQGSLAALRCAALAGCPPCGGACYGGCGGAGCGTMVDSGGYLTTPVRGFPSYAVPEGIAPHGPIEVPEELEDPFTDDPVDTPEDPQARGIRRRQPATRPSVLTASRGANRPVRSRYLRGRPVNIRR